MLQSFFHFNIVVADIAASIAFYEKLGFELRERVDPEGEDIAFHLGAKVDALTAAIMVPPDGPAMPMLDLVEYRRPRSHGAPYPSLDHVGIARVAFRVDDFDVALTRLRNLGVSFVGPDVSYPGPGGKMLRTVCFHDPDGTTLQIIGETR